MRGYGRVRKQLALLFRLLVFVTLIVVSPAVWCAYYFTTDVPASLGGIEYSPNDVIRNQGGDYLLEVSLPPNTELGALARRGDGLWLFAVAAPANLSGTGFDPRDIVAYDGISFAKLLDGSSEGIPIYARVDALFLDGGGDFVMSYDVPVNLDGIEYSQSDLVRYDGNGSFSLFWDAEAAGVPASTNVSGADVDGAGNLVFTFDVPTNLGGTVFLPGQLVRWEVGSGFTLYLSDGSWPASVQLRDIAFVPAAGSVPGDFSSVGSPLRVTRDLTTGDLTLTWDMSCLTGDNDYAIYEGTAGNYYSHTEKFCSTGNTTMKTFSPAAGDTYYIVVSLNGMAEGSYGRNSADVERPQGTAACLVQEIASCP